MKGFIERMEDVYAAAAFAEAGEFDTAEEILRGESYCKKQQREISCNGAITAEEGSSKDI